MLYNKENFKLIKLTFDYVEIIPDGNNEWQTEPAVIRHEIVHIAETISELQLNIRAEHKGVIPETAAKLFFRIRIRQNMDCEIDRKLDRLVP